MKKITVLLLGALSLANSASADTVFTMGDVERVKALFSYPNNCNTICYNDQTLEETVKHYLSNSLERDGYEVENITVTVKDGKVEIYLPGDVPTRYSDTINDLLDAGDLALSGAHQMLKDGEWKSDWRFFLPLGLAMDQHESVQLLHFPPDYVLEDVQDYLDANTTRRWAELLVANGVLEEDTDKYQTIIDVAPIAAPAKAGRTLNKSYPYFTDYTKKLINDWTEEKSGAAGSKPMVVYGWPARNWLNDTYGTSLSIMQTDVVTLGDGRDVNVLATNHPSYIWYASNPKNCSENEEEARRRGLKIMVQDLTAACWQGKMADDSSLDSESTLQECQSHWLANPQMVCEMFQTQVKGESRDQASKSCKGADEKSLTGFSDVDAAKIELMTPIEALSRNYDR